MPSFGRTIAGAVLAAGVLLSFPTSANAQVAQAQTAKVADSANSVETVFKLTRFDAKVARAHGYEVVTLPDGSRASVPAARAAAARAGHYVPRSGVIKPAAKPSGGASTSAYDENAGECGRSYVSLNSIGARKANLGTGFFIDNPKAGTAFDVHWHVGIVDNGGSSQQNYSEGGGRLAGVAWLGKNRVVSLTRGYATAKVTTGSFAITTRGWVCYSYGPQVTEFIS